MTAVIGGSRTRAYVIGERVRMADSTSPRPDPTTALGELCAFDVARHHQDLRADVQRVATLLQPLADDGPPAAAILEVFDDLAGFLERHLSKEEHILLPALSAVADAFSHANPRPPLPFPSLLNPIRMLEGEHLRLQEMGDRLRQATGGLMVPDDAGAHWRQAYEGLATLDVAVTEHVRFENEHLFPLALDVERRLG